MDDVICTAYRSDLPKGVVWEERHKTVGARNSQTLYTRYQPASHGDHRYRSRYTEVQVRSG